MSANFVRLERQTMLAPLGLRFRDASTGALVDDGLSVTAYPSASPAARTRALPNRTGTYVLHAASGLPEATRGAGDQEFWDRVVTKPFTVEVVDERRRYLPFTFGAGLPARGIFTWVWPLAESTARPRPAPAASFADDFSDDARDAARWRLGTMNTPASAAFDAGVTAVERGGRLGVTPLTSQGGRHFNGYLSAVTWNATNARATAGVAQATSGAAETLFTLAHDGDNWFRFVVQSGRLLFQTRIAGIESATNVVYDPAQHRWWRLRHDAAGDQVVFETSGDGASWARRRVVDRRIPITAMTIELGAGSASSVGSPGVAQFDDFRMESNPTPAVPLYSAPARAGLDATAVVRAELWDPLAANGAGAPASYAVLEARAPAQAAVRGLADREGRVAILFPYPEPVGASDGDGNAQPAAAYTRHEWEVELRAYYRPQIPVPPLADLGAALAQPLASLWADEARATPLSVRTLRFGQELVVRTRRTTTGAPLEPVPLPVLLITPAA